MKAEEIDEILTGNIWNVLEKYGGLDKTESEDEDIEKAKKNIMSKIENGDYNYFKKQIPSYYMAIELMKYSSKTDDIKSLIEKLKELDEELDEDTIMDLIIATRDVEYMKTCIETGVVYGKVLVRVVMNNREKMGLTTNDIIGLIIATKDTNYITKCLMDRENLGLDSNDAVTIILGTKDPNYITKCLMNRENLGLDSYDAGTIIIGTKDPNYITKCLMDRENLGLDSYAVGAIIIRTKDPNYITKCLMDRENLGLNSSDVKTIILKTEDHNYITKCLMDRENLGLNSSDVKTIILGTKNYKYITSCIVSREKFGLDFDDVRDMIYPILEIEKSDNLSEVDLILATGNVDLIEKYMEQVKDSNINPIDIQRLSLFTQETNIVLPPEMTIGVEIESEGDMSRNVIIRSLVQNKLKWEAKDDGSLQTGKGTEVVSPILTGDTEKSSNEIRKVCSILNGVHQTTNQRCGGHIHIGADYLKSKNDWVNLIKIWANAENVLYTISNQEGTIPRDGVPRFAVPISKKIQTALEDGTINLEGEQDLDEFATQVVGMQEKYSERARERYSGINFLNIGPGKKNTIEFRLSNGTINPNTWIENINLFGGIVRCAHELTEIQEKKEEQRSETERRMLESFEILQTEQDEQLILKALLELAVSPEQRQVYMTRYSINEQLLNNAPEISNAIKNQITSNKIGKKVFTGDKAESGVDYQQGSALIEQMLEKTEIIRNSGSREE